MAHKNDQREDRSLWRSVFSFLSKLISKDDGRYDRKIVRENDGFTLYLNDEPNWSIRWKEVTAVVAYKQDLYTTDLICFGLRVLKDPAGLWCIDEDMEGFKSVSGDISHLTHGAWPDKWHDIAIPAFETCWTELWIRDGSPILDDNPKIWYAK